MSHERILQDQPARRYLTCLLNFFASTRFLRGAFVSEREPVRASKRERERERERGCVCVKEHPFLACNTKQW